MPAAAVRIRVMEEVLSGNPKVVDNRNSELLDGDNQRIILPGLHVAVTALTLLILNDCLEQIRSPKIGPECLGHVNLAVGNLPQQKIRYAHLTTRPNKQIRIGKTFGEKMSLQVGLGNLVRIAAERDPFSDQLARRLDDL